ncbi:MAG: hypothetical protein AAFV33_22610 [Chloroflexota bacterium]
MNNQDNRTWLNVALVLLGLIIIGVAVTFPGPIIRVVPPLAPEFEQGTATMRANFQLTATAIIAGATLTAQAPTDDEPDIFMQTATALIAAATQTAEASE